MIVSKGPRFTYGLILLSCVFAWNQLFAWSTSPESGKLTAFRYSPEDHPGGSFSQDIAEDREGNLYFANQSGVVKYDGEVWSLLPPTGHSVMTSSVVIDSEGHIWAAASETLGYYAPTPEGDYLYYDMSDSLAKLPFAQEELGLFFKLESLNGKIQLFTSFYMLEWDGSHWKNWKFSTARRILPNIVGDEIYIHSRGQGLFRFVHGEFEQILAPSPEIASGIIRIVKPEASELRLITVSNGFWSYRDGTLEPHQSKLSELLQDRIVWCAEKLNASTFAMGVQGLGIVIANFDDSLVDVIPESTGIMHIEAIRNGDIWACATNAIAHVPNWPLSQISSTQQLGLTRHHNSLYVGNNNQLNRLIPKGSINDHTQLEVIDDNAIADTIISSGAELLYTKNRWVLIRSNGQLIDTIEHTRIFESLHRSPYDPNTIYAMDSPAISRLKRSEAGWELFDSATKPAIRGLSVAELKDGSTLASSESGHLRQIFWEGTADGAPQAIRWGSAHGLPEDFLWSHLLQQDSRILLLSDKGCFQYDEHSNRFTAIDGLLVDALANDAWSYSYTTLADDAGWIVSIPESERYPKGLIGAIRENDGTYLWEPWYLPGYSQVGHTKGLLHESTDDGQTLWLATDKGAFRYDVTDKPAAPLPSTTIQNVSESKSKSGYYGGFGPISKLDKLPYPQPELNFRYAATPGHLNILGYQHRLLGLNENWSDTDRAISRNYTSLREGRYEFQVRAVDEFGRVGPVTSVTFTILPPWHRSSVAYAGYIIGLVLLLYLSAGWWTRRLRKRNEELEQVVGMRTLELERRNLELTKANAVKQDFLASMSHEIRNPLNGILGIARLMRDQAKHKREDDERLQHLFNCASHLHQLLGEVLDYSSLEAGQLHAKRVSFNPLTLTEEACSMHRTMAEDKGLDLKLELPDLKHEWMSDPVLLRQILINLISNAIKYTPSGSVELRLELQGELAIFSVTDTGPGIPQDKQQEIFEKFTRLSKAAESQIEGTGLGLAIASQMSVLLGGELTLDGNYTQGARFCLQLRAEPSQLQIKPSGLTKNPFSRPLRSLRVLVADDMDFNRYINSELVKQLGATTTVVNGGEGALDELLNSSYDLALLDINMPDLSGIEVIQKYLESAPVQPAKLIALSAHSTEKMQGDCLEAGFNYFIEKPLEPEKLLRVIDRGSNRRTMPTGSLLDYLADNNPEANDALKQRFDKSMTNELQKLREAILGESKHEVTETLHKIKGLAALLKEGPIDTAVEALSNSLAILSNHEDSLQAVDQFEATTKS